MFKLILQAAALASAALLGSAHAQAGTGLFFDDFSYTSLEQAKAHGWTPRVASGHPGVPGASWSEQGLRLGAGLLTLQASTTGSAAGTQQAQICHARKYLEGTYAARVRFSDVPVSGADGDPIIQTFYAVAPLKHDFDPDFSELDWEYLANGGWGSDKQRLYGISWQTVRLDPWQAHNQMHEEMGSHAGWRVLMMQVDAGKVRWFIDGRQVTQHGGRNYPVVPLSINFNLWFSPGGLLPESAEARVYEQDVDWVFHAQNRVLTPAQVLAAVRNYRAKGVAHADTVAPATPALESRCDF